MSTESDELRALIREAHEATRDLRQAVKDARQERAIHTADARAELASIAGELVSRGITDYLKSNAGRNMINVHIRQLVTVETKKQLDKFDKDCEEIYKIETARLRSTLESIKTANTNADKSLDTFAREAARIRDAAIRETRLAVSRMTGGSESHGEPRPRPGRHEPGHEPGGSGRAA